MTIKEVSFALENWLEGADIEWHLSFEPDLDNQQDATFYQGLGAIATVSYKQIAVKIYSDGDLRATYKEQTLRTTTDFFDAGITNDQDLRNACEQNEIEYDMNNWFDLYSYGEHLDCVQHTIGEAIMSASAYVRDESMQIETLENLTIS
jgi:hypothetical protein